MDSSILRGGEKKKTLTTVLRTWQNAILTIYCSRAFLSVTKNIVTTVANKTPLLLRSKSYTTINIINDDDHFSIDQSTLVDLVKDKSISKLEDLGGVEGISKALKTGSENGIQSNEEDIARRKEVFGSNTYTRPPAKSFFYFVWKASKVLTIVTVIICAALSLGFGIKVNGAQGLNDGLSIFLSGFLIIVVSAICNYRQSQHFNPLSKINVNNNVEVIRDGRRQHISITEIVVGDAILLNVGDKVPADGLLLEGHSLKVNESSMTGESEPVEVNPSQNPFLFNGTEIVAGYAKMVVTSVGMNTTWGLMMSQISRHSDEETPLQARLKKLTSVIGKVGLLVLIVVTVILYLGPKKPKKEIVLVKEIMDVAAMIILVAIPEGLPLAVTLTLAYRMKRMKQMTSDNTVPRKLSACETMGSATTICTDKTGTLTMNVMKVTKFWIGKESFDGSSSIAPYIAGLFREGVAMNTTGSVFRDKDSGFGFSGSPTERAILSWAIEEMDMDMDEEKNRCVKIVVETFNSRKKRSGAMIKRVADGTLWTYWKGAAEIVLAMCSGYYDASGKMKELDNNSRSDFERIIEGMAASSLRCIAFAAKPNQIKANSTTMTLDDQELILLGIVGIKDTCHPGARDAVQACRRAGVDVKLITGDNVFTAKAIAAECDILEPGKDAANAIIKGAEFQALTTEERLNRVEHIRVMARSSPSDKLLMVQSLKEKGHVVAVIGKRTSDATALKEADIGLSMGIQGTEVAKESSDIVILDDNFASVATALGWGRCLYNNIQKLIQFNLTANAAALVINFASMINNRETPLSTVPLLWVNLIVNTLGVLALAAEKPTNELMESPPVGRTEPLITNVMLRNLLAQATFQICMVLVFQFKGQSIFGVEESVNSTMIFNTFVLCQVFNELNARKLEKRNVFRGIRRNKLFMGIMAVTLVIQVLMVEFLQKIEKDTKRLNLVQWGVCLGIASMSWPIGWVVKCVPVPNKPFFTYLKGIFLKRNME